MEYAPVRSKAVISGRSGSTWNPGYSSSTNHYTCSGCTYDSDGDVTYDGNNSYQWNGFEKLASTVTGGSGTPTCGTSGECLTYDAFGRVVEFSYNGSSWEELQQLQGGAVQSYVSGTTANYGRFPGPGGGTIVTGGNVTLYWAHNDWIGNARITSNINTNAYYADKAYTPYGEIYSAFGSGITQQTDFFAGTSTAFNPLGVTMWDTPNRELSIVGRWLSPDPAGYGWNQYAYPTNPNSFVDPLGLGPGGPGGPTCLAARRMGQTGCSEGQTNYGGGSIDDLSGWFSNFDQVLTNASGTVGADWSGTITTTVVDANGNQLLQWSLFLFGVQVNAPLEIVAPPISVDAANNGTFLGWDANAWRAFRNSLFSWKNFSAGFKEGGCFSQFAEEAFDPADANGLQDQAIKATAQSGAYVAATAYAANQGLIVPMRSSIVRGILDFGETLGESAALGATVYSEGKALVNEVKSFQSGQCQ